MDKSVEKEAVQTKDISQAVITRLPRYFRYLGDLRDAWIDNPCYETANTYTDALSEVIDKLEQKTTPQKKDTVITAGVAV